MHNKVIQGINDLATTNPEILKEWDYDKNNPFLPTTTTKTSSKQVWWKCSKNHEYPLSIANRVNSKSGCPYCANRKNLNGSYDISTTHPDIAKEWHPTKNGDLSPEQFKRSSAQMVWWQCKDGHEWEQRIRYRCKKNSICPTCKQLSRLGTTNRMRNGQMAVITEYRKSHDIDITFEDGTIITGVRYGTFMDGMIANPNYVKPKKEKTYLQESTVINRN